MGIDYDYSNISLSTAELESVDGEVLSNKDQVWANAGACFYNSSILHFLFVTEILTHSIYCFVNAEKQAALFQQQLANDARY